MEALHLLAKSMTGLERLKVGEESLLAGRLTPATFKPFAAPQGVYEQKDGLFMFRVRIPGGHIESSGLLKLAELAKAHGAAYGHITTRQDLQLHGIKIGGLYPLALSLAKAGFPVRGGGGDTFRNLVSCPLTGLSPESFFDVQPFVRALSDFLLGFDKLFELPRKYKIAVSCCRRDCAGAAWHDLGFAAKLSQEGEIGFAVFGGGGLGRMPEPAVSLMDFVPVSDAFRCAVAMGELFHEHGDRRDRGSARVRFILKRLGEENFRKLFLEFFGRVRDLEVPSAKLSAGTRSDKGGSKLFNLPLKNGNLTIDSLERLARLAIMFGQPFIRLSQDQSIWLPALCERAASAFFDEFSGAATKLKLVSCVGAGVCKIGILDSQMAAQRIAKALMSMPVAKERIAEFASFMRISGCQNSCSGHPVCALGFQGVRKKLGDGGASKSFYKVFAGGFWKSGRAVLGDSSDGWLIEEERVGDFAAFAVQKFLADGGRLSFHEWIASEAAALFDAWSADGVKLYTKLQSKG